MGHLLPIIGMGLTVGGNLLNGINQQQYVEAQQKAQLDAYLHSKKMREQEIGRQDAYQQTADQQVAEATNIASAATNQQNRTAAEQAFMDLYNERGSETVPEGFLAPGQEHTTDLIKTEIAKRAATAASDARARIQALAGVRSFDTALAQSGLGMQETANKLATLGGMRRGSLAVSGQEQGIPAIQVAPGHNLLGPLMTTAGGITSSFGGTPGGFGGFTVNPATGAVQQNWGIFNGLVGGYGAGS